MKIICKQCGKEFELSESEINFYKSKGLSLPKRCKACREANKHESDKKNSNSVKSEPSVFIPADSGKKSGFNKKIIIPIVIVVAALLGVKFFSGIDRQDDLPTETSRIIETVSQSEMEISEEDTTLDDYDYSSDTAEEEYTFFEEVEPETENEYISHHFRNKKLLDNHYKKHGIEMGFDSAEDYEAAASAVVDNPNALSKHESEDNDMVYYIKDTQEIVFVSTDGYIRTYFIASYDYYGRQ